MSYQAISKEEKELLKEIFREQQRREAMRDLLREAVKLAEQQPLTHFALHDLTEKLGYSFDMENKAELILIEHGWLTRNPSGQLVPSKKLRDYRAGIIPEDLRRFRLSVDQYRLEMQNITTQKG